MMRRSRRAGSATDETKRSIQRYCSRDEAGSTRTKFEIFSAIWRLRIGASGSPETTVRTWPVVRSRKLSVSGALRSTAVSSASQSRGMGLGLMGLGPQILNGSVDVLAWQGALTLQDPQLECRPPMARV